MSKYFLRPLEVEAVMFDGKTVGDRDKDGFVIEGTTPAWFAPHTTSRLSSDISVPIPVGDIMQTGDGRLLAGTHRGTVTVVPGDWLVMYPDGSLIVEKADVFAVTYALPLDVVKDLGGDIIGLIEQDTGSWLGRLLGRAKSLLKAEGDRLL